MKERFNRFMSGRYGTDELSRFILGVFIVCMAANIFSRRGIFYTLSLFLLAVAYFRMFSKNYAARYAENQKYLSLKEQVLSRLGLTKRQINQRKKFHIYHCPSCKQKIRIPRGKGKICITCPKCRHEFVKKS